jgi:hypothetical protein
VQPDAAGCFLRAMADDAFLKQNRPDLGVEIDSGGQNARRQERK